MNVIPAMLSVPVRAVPVLAATEYVTVAEPVLDFALVMEIQLAPLAAVQDAPAGFTVSATCPTPPAAGTLAEVGASEKDALPADWLTVSVTPPAVMPPFRTEMVLFDATVKLTLPLPIPELGVASVIHEFVLAADQAQPACVVTMKEKLPPAAPALVPVGFSVYEQTCWTVTASGAVWLKPPPEAVIERL